MYKISDILGVLGHQIKNIINIKNNDQITEISWISNKKIENGLFIALKGKNTDGHLFIEDAYKNGYRFFLVNEHLILPADAKVIICESTSVAFDTLAKWGSDNFKGKFIGITGVAGKTSTTYLLANILQDYGYKVISTFKYNTSHYLRALLFSLAWNDSDYCVLELSSDCLGHIKYLGSLVTLDWGIITSLGKSHLRGMINEKGVYEEKLSLASFTKYQVFINSKYENILPNNIKHQYNNIQYVPINYEKKQHGYLLKINDIELFINKTNYNIQNSILILNLLKNMELDITKAKYTLENLCAFINRGNIIHYKNKNYDFIFHTYAHNANPVSFVNNIEDMNKLEVKYACIKTDLLDLGEEGDGENKKLFKFLVEENDNLIYIVQILLNMKYEDFQHKKLLDHNNIPVLIQSFKDNHIQHIFVQGNRAIKLELYVEKILNYLDTTE